MQLSVPMLLSMFLSLMPAGMTTGDTSFLERELLLVPTTGVVKTTSAPLEPYRVYRVQISSPRDLADITQGHVEVFLNGSPAKILDFDTGLFETVLHVYTLILGAGDPLKIQLMPHSTVGSSRLDKFTQRVPTIEVMVSRHPWWLDHRSLGVRPEAIYAASVLIGIAVLAYVRLRYGRDALRRFLAQFTPAPHRGMGFPPPQRRAPGRVRVVRDDVREDGALHEP
jgi:hypothetical protein